MTADQLYEKIKAKKSYLCIGLDTDLQKIPKHLLKSDDAVFEFNKQIIDATHHLTIAYKPNMAFYEAYGKKGWASLEKTVDYIRSNYPELFLIADAKRGDIDSTAKMYARAFFEHLNFDAVTLSPYMGKDAIMPFLDYPNKWVIVLALNSNKSAVDFQVLQECETNEYLFEKVLKYGSKWGNTNNTMFVVGAQMAYKLQQVRLIVPKHFLLVPGIGAQGGSLSDVSKYGMNEQCGLIVNVSRTILYADNTEKFAEKASIEAAKIQKEMHSLLKYNEE